MTSVTTKPDSSQPAAETAVYLFDNWFDPIEDGLHGQPPWLAAERIFNSKILENRILERHENRTPARQTQGR